jgi:mannose-6-phosphate isomerase
MLSERAALLGNSKPSHDDAFPLLVKLLDAHLPLSVQVHPDARTAELLGHGAEPKSECWYVLDAVPGAEFYLGLRPDVDASTFAECATRADVVGLLQVHEARPGQFVQVPAGTVHSIGGGVTLVEVQENSDTTFRLYDWDRTDDEGRARPLQLEAALAAIDYGRAAPAPVEAALLGGGVNGQVTLAGEDTAFGVELLAIHEPLEHDTAERAWAYVVLAGRGELLRCGDAADRRWAIRRGETWLLPADLGRYRFTALDGELLVLRVEARA